MNAFSRNNFERIISLVEFLYIPTDLEKVIMWKISIPKKDYIEVRSSDPFSVAARKLTLIVMRADELSRASENQKFERKITA